MRKWFLILALVLATTALAGVALAQDATPTPEPAGATIPAGPETGPDTEAITVTDVLTEVDGITDSRVMTVVRSLRLLNREVSLMTLDIGAGFVLDPFFVAVNGGGTVPASSLDPACVGYVNDAPVLTINTDALAANVTVFVYSDHDPSLVIGLPDGTFVCNDNAGAAVLDPQIQVENPEAGAYRIWVGSKRPLDLIPGVLVLTTKPEFSLGSFALGSLVRRPTVPIDAPTAGDVLPEAKAFQERLSGRLSRAIVPALEEGQTLTASVTITGLRPAFLFTTAVESPVPACAGLINDASQIDFGITEGMDRARVFFEGDGDATLILVRPDGKALCIDDSADGANLNPLLDLAGLEPGNYAAVVGRLSADTPLNGVLTVTANPDITPAILERGAGEGAQQ